MTCPSCLERHDESILASYGTQEGKRSHACTLDHNTRKCTPFTAVHKRPANRHNTPNVVPSPLYLCAFTPGLGCLNMLIVWPYIIGSACLCLVCFAMHVYARSSSLISIRVRVQQFCEALSMHTCTLQTGMMPALESDGLVARLANALHLGGVFGGVLVRMRNS